MPPRPYDTPSRASFHPRQLRYRISRGMLSLARPPSFRPVPHSLRYKPCSPVATHLYRRPFQSRIPCQCTSARCLPPTTSRQILPTQSPAFRSCCCRGASMALSDLLIILRESRTFPTARTHISLPRLLLGGLKTKVPVPRVSNLPTASIQSGHSQA